MMGLKVELDAVLGALQAIIGLVEHIDPQAAQNPVVIELQKVINLLKSLGL